MSEPATNFAESLRDPDAVVVAFWCALGPNAGTYYSRPDRVYDDPIYRMRTKRISGDGDGAFMFDDPFWDAFHAAGLRVCHVQWLSAEQTEGGCNDRVFEIRFMPPAPVQSDEEAAP